MARSMRRKSCAYRRQGTTKQRKSMKRKVQSTPQRGGNGCKRPVSQRGGNGCRRPVSQRGSGRGHNHGSVGPANRAGPYRRFKSRRNRKRVICAGDDCPQRKR